MPDETRDTQLPVVAIGVMDRELWRANTDNLVVVDPARTTVTWIPRDLWSPRVGDRINRAWAEGGAPLLLAALAEQGVRADAAVCVLRSVMEEALADVDVVVPVAEAMEFLYPQAPQLRIQDGATLVRFEPPSERLSGVRVHQWIGARYGASSPGSDLDRIRRQQVLLRALLLQGSLRATCSSDDERIRGADAAALRSLASIDASWSFEVIDDVLPRWIEGKEMLVRATRAAWLRYHAGRAYRRGGSVLMGIDGRLRLPTGGLRRPSRTVRLIAVIAVKDEERFLPGWLENVAPQVDGIVALDDGSSDRSAEILASHPKVLTLLGRLEGTEGWDEVGNHRRLVHAALAQGAGWIVALDADERVEAGFRDRAERAIRRGERLGLSAFALPLHELWDSRDTWRSDGVWGRKRAPRLFAAREDHRFDLRPLHAAKAPLQGKRFGVYLTADARVYHLRMIEAADRAARRSRYEELDPDGRWQPMGYAYLTDEEGLRLRRIPRRRRPAAW